jgi:hypothetical protein
MAIQYCQSLSLVLSLSVFVFPLSQTAAEKKPPVKIVEKEASKAIEVDRDEEQRRTFAVSLIISLANEARGYDDQNLSAKVIARAADALWGADTDAARQLFRRAWEIAEKRDADEATAKPEAGVPSTVAALRKLSGRDLRLEVLNLIARRDRPLAEEFLEKLKEDTKRAAANSENDSTSRSAGDSWSIPDSLSKRLQVARALLEDGDIERSLQFAAPALDKVNVNSILFLSLLRQKRADVADQKFAVLLDRAEFDAASDANTVSGLSSYVFTPGLYVTFSPEGSARWSQPEQPTSPPNLPATLRNRFFQAAASILLRPQPPPDQDFTSSGVAGTCMVINRLLPLFEQYTPDTAVALRSRLKAWTSDGPRRGLGTDSPLLTQDLQPEETSASALESMQYKLDHAKTSRERDRIYTDAAVALASQGDARAQALADKIDDADRRGQVRQYVDFQFVQLAIKKKEGLRVVRLARDGQLTHTQRVWAYTQAARLLMPAEGQRAREVLEEATNEARRINQDDPDRVRSLIGIATQFASVDRVRAWEILDEAVKSANATEKFTGDSGQLHFSMLMTTSGVKISSVAAEDFSLAGVLRSLAKDDLYRSISLAKSFKEDAPRATAILAIAKSILER